jgi:hypothetical protein
MPPIRRCSGCTRKPSPTTKRHPPSSTTSCTTSCSSSGWRRSTRWSEDELLAWLAALNDVRLVLGVRLAVTEEATVADFAGDPEAERAYDLYRYLSYLEEQVVDALSS